MHMSEAGEVAQVAGAKRANEMLADGWILLAVVPNANVDGLAHVAYVFGKPRQEEAQGFFADSTWIDG